MATTRSWALALKGAACLAVAVAVAGCSGGGSSSSSVTITGNTLRIYLSQPADIKSDPVAQDIVDAERLEFTLHHDEVKDFRLEIVFPPTGESVSDNARLAIEDQYAIAYLGEIAPGNSDQTVGITNALDLLEVSPTDTALELGQSTRAVSGAPESYFESWGTYGRTFARVVPTSAQEASAQVAEIKSLGVSSLYVGDDGSGYGRALAQAVRDDARSAGISLASDLSGAGGIFYGAESAANAADFFNRASTTAPTAKLFGPSSLNSGIFTAAVSSSVHDLYVTIPGFMPKQLNASARAFQVAFTAEYHRQPNVEAIFGYGAMSALLSVLEGAGHSANDRATVAKDFLKLSVTQSVLGSYRINSAGNTSLDAFVIAHLVDGKLVPFKAAPSL